MEQLPKLVRDRLQQIGAARSPSRVGQHPDPDLLTAFVERSLSDRERNQVATHLSQCRECRDVVAVATPELTSPSPVPRRLHGPQPWFRWPALRWGALAASVVIVAAAVIISTKEPENAESLYTFSTDAKQSSPQPQSADHVSSEVSADKDLQTKPAASPAIARSQQPAQKVPERPAPKAQPGAATGAVGALGGSGASDGVPSSVASPPQLANENKPSQEQLQKFAVKEIPGNPARQDALKDKPTLAIPRAVPPSPPDSGTDQLARTPPAAGTVIAQSVTVQATSPMATDEVVARAKTSRTEHAKAETATAPSPSASSAYANRALTDTAASAPIGLMPDLKLPKWSLSQDGLPQRSFDFGKSWEKIPIENKNGFRALSANGMDIWVGGPTGLLYHSTDIGLHWTRVIPVADAATLSTDIVRIEFADAAHGKVMTSTGETWTTSDQGKTWTRQ